MSAVCRTSEIRQKFCLDKLIEIRKLVCFMVELKDVSVTYSSGVDDNISIFDTIIYLDNCEIPYF